MIRPVLLYPDPVLKRVCEPVKGALAGRIAADLIDTMRAHPGCVGLAAPQIGEPVRVAVVDVSGHRRATNHHGLLVLVNPVIEEVVGTELGREGCQSLPSITADVRRSEQVRVVARALDLWAVGFEARAIQHELDHLDGILILDRVESAHALHLRRQPPRRGEV